MRDGHATVGTNVKVEWHLTYNCNLNCAHCGVVKYRNVDFLKHYYPRNGFTHDLRGDDWKPFFNLVDNERYYKFSVWFSPNIGESTIHPDFVNIWNTASSIKNVASLALTTNGTLLYKLLSDMEVEKLNNIVFSLDGNERTHDRIRGKGVFKRVYKSILKIDELKQDDTSFHLQINFVATKINIESLKELPFILGDLNSKNIMINILSLGTDEGNAKVNKDILKIEDRNELIEWIKIAYSELRTINDNRRNQRKEPIKLRLMGFTSKQVLDIVSGLERVSLSDFIISHKGWKNSCSAYLRKKLYVDPFGNFFPCGAFASPEVLSKLYSAKGYVNVPNIRDEFGSIDGILDSRFFTVAREWLNELYVSLKPCSSCPLKNSCAVCPVYASVWGVPHECYER